MEETMRALLAGIILASFYSTCGVAQEKKAVERQPDLSLTAVGRQHHAIQTQNKEAQDYFDQGITLIYGFNHEEAGRAFQRAAELDPASPMPLWGIALAVGPNYNADVDAEREKLAYDAIQKAQKHAGHAPEVERDYVAALAARFSGDAKPDFKKLSLDYVSKMKALSEKYPDDLDAATLYAESLMDLNPWKLWTLDGKPAENTEEIVRVLESVLERDPNHVGANHFYVHAMEASTHPERALPSARRRETLVPQAGHLVHMPSHIYARTGYYEEALKSNVEATRIDRVYAQKAEQEGSIYDLMYHSHNEHFLASAASMAGRYAEAKAAADALARRLLPHAAEMPMLDYFVLVPIWVDARFGKWDAILAKPEPAKSLPGTHVMWRYSRVLALAAKGNHDKAAGERQQFAAESAAFPAEASLGQFNSGKVLLDLATHILGARLAMASGKKEEAIAQWRKAVVIQDGLSYNEPPDWYYPVRESLGGSLLSAGRAADAEQVFREDLKQNPRNPRSLFGLMHSLKAQHKETDAAWVQKQFESAWKNADTQLQLSEL
jgi:tetratricopeptide (TPR) repeat protein